MLSSPFPHSHPSFFSVHLNVPPLSVGSPRKLGTQCCCTFVKTPYGSDPPRVGRKADRPAGASNTTTNIRSLTCGTTGSLMCIYLGLVFFFIIYFAGVSTCYPPYSAVTCKVRNVQGSSYRREDGGEGNPAVALVPIGLHPCSAPSLLLPSSSS